MSFAQVALVTTAVFFASCRKPLPPKPASVPTPGAGKDDVVLMVDTQGIALPATCTPSGPELCFDASDNNCNGVIDEGCGLGTGPLQFAIAWAEGPDVDLKVTYRKKGEKTEGILAELIKDKECGRPQNNCHGQNVENIYFAGDRPPPGVYRVEIKLDNAEDVHSAVQVRFGVRLGSRTLSFPPSAVELRSSQQSGAGRDPDAGPKKMFSFEIK